MNTEPTKLPPLRPVMTQRERVLENMLFAIHDACELCINSKSVGMQDIIHINQLVDKALNFKYGGGE